MLGRLADRSHKNSMALPAIKTPNIHSLRVRGSPKPSKSLLDPAGWSAGTAGGVRGGDRGQLRKLPRHAMGAVLPESLNVMKFYSIHISTARTLDFPVYIQNTPSTCCDPVLFCHRPGSDVRPRETRGDLQSKSGRVRRTFLSGIHWRLTQTTRCVHIQTLKRALAANSWVSTVS